MGISRIERRGRREIEQPKVGPKGELSGSERVNSEFLSAGWGQSQFHFLFGIKWAQRREGDRIFRINRIETFGKDRESQARGS